MGGLHRLGGRGRCSLTGAIKWISSAQTGSDNVLQKVVGKQQSQAMQTSSDGRDKDYFQGKNTDALNPKRRPFKYTVKQGKDRLSSIKFKTNLDSNKVKPK